jgi:hypothetical protein
MTHDEKHNGWTNYETWLVALWLDSYGYLEDYRRQTSDENLNVYQLADRMKQQMEEGVPDEYSDVYFDLVYAGIQKVNFDEIATKTIDDMEMAATQEEATA